MPKQVFCFFLFFISVYVFPQEYSSLWEGHFSYYDVVDVSQGNDKLFAAAENAIFSYDVNTMALETLTTIDGLSGETISQIHYSANYHILIIGYENGLMEVVSLIDGTVLTVVDILDKQNISPLNKRINHFNEYDGLLYISTDYGISVYDLEALEFGDTYYIGNNGTQIPIRQTAIYNNAIYVACGDGNGLKWAELNNPNLIDFQQWQNVSGGNWVAVEAVEDNLYAIRENKTLVRIENNTLNNLFVYNTLPVDARSVQNQLIVTTAEAVFVYDENFNLISNFENSVDFETNFTASTLLGDNIFIGTEDYGVLTANINSVNNYSEIRPQGPLLNNTFKIQAVNGNVWASFGDYTVTYHPSPLRRYGISHFSNDEWFNIPYEDLLDAANLNYIAVNPFNNNQVFVSSFQHGLLEINNDEVTLLHNQENSGLESLIIPSNPNTISLRLSGNTFDSNGILWTLTARVQRPLKSYDPSTGQWQGYDFSTILEDPLSSEFGYSDIIIADNGTKWIGGYKLGVVAYNENGAQIKNLSTMEQGMPSTNVWALALDAQGQLWIGTDRGIRVLYNTTGFFDDSNSEVNQIVIMDDGIPQELLANQFITDIKVDGSNNKWVGTLSSGVFYFSPDGQETIYHFTKDNSPLPSNHITDMAIDDSNGRIYIATTRGMVSFASGGSKPSDKLDEAYVYPNPVRPEYELLGASDLNNITKNIKIKGLTENVNIKITDIAGNLVNEAQSGVNFRASKANYNFAIDGGTAIWNGKNLANNIVASGVYLIMITDLDTLETKVLKLLIIR